MTKIEWATKSWNPVVGCSKMSPGCDNCYAIGMAHRVNGMQLKRPELKNRAYVPALTVKPDDGPVDWTGEVRTLPHRLDEPLRWRKPRRVFVNSMSDLFHPNVDGEFIGDVWATMAEADRHQFQILTKRSKRMQAWCAEAKSWTNGDSVLPNIWLGVSVESAQYKFRIDHLRETPAAVRWLSIEPLIGPLGDLDLTGIDWVVVGGESGPVARPMHPDWVREIRDQCIAQQVPFFFKQWGQWDVWGNLPKSSGSPIEAVVPYDSGPENTYWQMPPHMDSPEFKAWAHRCRKYQPAVAMYRHASKKTTGRELDGREWNEYPEVTP